MNVAAATEVTANWDGPSPSVSVVISTRNHAQYLGAAIEAVEGQRGVRPELIVVDNASSDGTEAVVRDFARHATIPFSYLRLPSDSGPARGRNEGLKLARGDVIAFTDADCVPGPDWLSEALAAMTAPSVGIVQGRTECYAERPAFFTHFIETRRFDSSFSTSNVVYRRAALGPHRFDPSCVYWEDTDLGFRVQGDGWDVAFTPSAIVYHQAVPLTARRWLTWPVRYTNWPAKAARYPEFRRTLFLGVWARPINAAFEVALIGITTSAATRRRWPMLAVLPYALAFGATRGLRGRAPVLKVGLHTVRDAVAFGSLVFGSIRHRTVVL